MAFSDVHASIQDRTYGFIHRVQDQEISNGVDYNQCQSLTSRYAQSTHIVTETHSDEDSISELPKWYTFIQQTKQCLSNEIRSFYSYGLIFDPQTLKLERTSILRTRSKLLCLKRGDRMLTWLASCTSVIIGRSYAVLTFSRI